MCGIAGHFRVDGILVEKADLARVSPAPVYDGPVSEGIGIDGPLGLGRRRLICFLPCLEHSDCEFG